MREPEQKKLFSPAFHIYSSVSESRRSSFPLLFTFTQVSLALERCPSPTLGHTLVVIDIGGGGGIRTLPGTGWLNSIPISEETPLHYAVCLSDEAMVRVLFLEHLEHRTDVAAIVATRPSRCATAVR